MRTRAGGLLAQFAQRRQFGVDLVEAGADGAEQTLARLGGRDAARGAGEQPKPETRLQLADRVAQRGLRNAELRRRPGEAALPRHGEEREDVVESASGHS